METQKAAQSSVATAIGFIQLRDAAAAGRGFAAELTVLRSAAPDDARFRDIMAQLDPYATKGAPLVGALRENFIELEAPVSVAMKRANAQTWWQRLLAELSDLISIRPLHGGDATNACATAEEALSAGDVNTALDAVKTLPPEAQDVLKDWKTKAEARAAIDVGMRDLSARFAALAGSSPASSRQDEAVKRFLGFILRLAILVAIAVWLADRPGTARVVWHGYVIETSAAFLGLTVLAAAFVFYMLFRLWQLLRHGPEHWRLRRRLKKWRQGHEQITEGLVAIAGGDAAEAGRHAVQARRLLGESTATRLLQAQAAQLAGDTRAAQEIFRALAADPDSAVLGYRGLIMEARRAGNIAEMERLVEKLHRLKPETPWLNLIRFELLARRQAWGEANTALAQAASARLLEPARTKRHRAALLTAASQSETRQGYKDKALPLAEQAARQAPGWLPAILNLAQAQMNSGPSSRRATHDRKTLE